MLLNNYTQHRFTWALAFVFLSACSVFLPSLQAQTSFIGPANGDWFTVANWSAGLPAPGNDANIPGVASPSIGSPLTVNFNITSFGSITNNSTFTVTSGTVVSGGIFINTGTVGVNAGQTFKSSGALTNSGAISNNGTFTANAPVTNAAAATITNNASFTLLANLSNSGSVVNSGGIFDCTQTITNSGAFDNQSGATLKLENGSGFTNSTTFTFTNEGTVTSSATFTNNGAIVNTGTFQNLFVLNNAGTLNNNTVGQFQNTSTVNNSGTFNNNTGGILATSFRFFNTGTINNYAILNNGDTIDNQAGGTFCNQPAGTLNSLFGSFILNEGAFLNKAGSTLVSNGEIDNNSGTFSNDGAINSADGSKIINSAAFNNTGNVVNINTLTNNATGSITNSGSFANNSGGILTNKGTILNNKTGTISNYFNIVNQAGATATNNGSFINVVRYDNFGTTTNNGYFNDVGDFTNEAGSALNNSEVFELNGGTLVNRGTVTNTKTFLVDVCSALSNYSLINNTGVFTSGGIIFQRGTVTGNAIVQKGGFIQTSATSDAPICRTGLSVGSDQNGAAKLYAQAAIVAGIDTCFNFQYFANGVSGRTIFDCTKVGTNQNVHLLLTTRTGDSLTCNTIVAVFDAVPPVLSSCPPDVTVLTGSASGAVYSWGTLTALDNCDPNPTLTSTFVSGQNFPLGVTKVTVTAKDKSANTSVCLFNVSVVQTTPVGVCTVGSKTPPTFSNCPSSVTVNSASGSQAVDWIEPTVSSACLPVVLTRTNAPGTIFGFGPTTVTYTATDANKNTSVCSFTITVTTPDPCVTDQTPPVVNNCPTNVFLITNPIINGAVGIWTPPTASDNCGTAFLTGNFVRGSIFPTGKTTVTYTATDAKGNASVCNFNVTVAATDPCPSPQNPVFSNCPASFTVNTSGNSAAVNFTAPTATDACGGITINSNYSPGAILPIGPTVITYVASDIKGNKSTCSFTATVANPCFIDSIKPIISGCPSNVIVSAGAGNTGVATWTPPTVTDNCGTPQFLSNYTPGASFPVGTTNVFYRATDARGNQALCTFTVMVISNICANDKTPPVIAGCPANITATAAAGATGAPATWTAPTATDNCSLQSLTASAQPGSTFNIGTTTVTYTAKDVAGNTATCTFSVTVSANACANDKTPPVIAGCPANITATAAAGATGATATWTPPTATDNCSLQSLTASAQPGSTFNIGTTTVVYTAKDAAGNTATCTFTVTVNANACSNDKTPPVIAGCPANITATATAGATGAMVIWIAPTATDNCSLQSLTASAQPGAIFPIGTTTVTYTAKDAAGNTAICTFTVTVNANACSNDKTPPVITGCPANISVTAAVGATGATASWTAPTATDNCSLQSLSASAQPGATFKIGATTVIYTAKDAAGNTSTCSFTVTVLAGQSGGNCGHVTAIYQIVDTKTSCGTGTPYTMYINGVYFSSTGDVTFTQYDNGVAVVNGTLASYGQKVKINLYLTGGTSSAPSGSPKLEMCTSKAASNWFYYPNWSGVIDFGGGVRFHPTRRGPSFQTGSGANLQEAVLGGSGWFTGEVDGDFNFNLGPQLPCNKICPAAAPTGNIVQETWNNVPGSWLSDLDKVASYPNSPDARATLSEFRMPQNNNVNTADRVRGFIYPPVTGNYTFYAYGDDNTLLFVSPDKQPAGKIRVCAVIGWTNEYEITKYPTQQSFQMQLTAGQPYYIELQHKQGGGGNNFGAMWLKPGDGQASVINGKYLSSYSECGATTPPVCATQGGLYHEIWQNQYSWVSPIVIPSNVSDQHNIIKTFDGPLNIGDNYESRAKGYIVPTVSGAYTFNETGDDYVEFYLSPDENPVNKKLIAFHYGWTNVGEYNKYPTQNSSVVNLQAGKYYYVELRHKEGSGTDFFSVNWTSPDNPSLHTIPTSCLFYPCSSNIGNLAVKSQLLTLNAYKDFRAAHLEWINNTGVHNDYFAVERLNNENGSFETISSQKGYFQESDVRTFTAVDQDPQNGDNFYRVKLTFRDGSVKYSETRQVGFGNLKEVSVFPNPTDGQINIDLKAFEGKEIEIFLYNQMGFEIKRLKTIASGAPQVIETDDLINGHYQVRIRTAGKRDVVKQVILLK